MIKKAQNFNPKTIPLPHQIEVINYIYKNNSIALFDEQGLGKTKIVIDALCLSMQNKEIEGVLVIAPMSLLYNWENEVKKHSFLVPIVLRGTEKEKKYKYLTGANFYIINYEAVISENARIVSFCKSYKTAIVLDESARIKDPKTKTAQAVFKVSPYAIKKIIISGTPVANKPFDLWSQYYFLDEGKIFGKEFCDFKLLYNEKNDDYLNNINNLKKKILNHSIRRTKRDVLELPNKNFINIYTSLSGYQLKLYDKLKDELIIEIRDIKGDIIIDESNNILKKLLRLTQITSNPAIIDKSYNETSVKVIELDKLVNQIISKNEKLLIWTCFIDNIIFLKNRYKIFKPLIIYGDVPIKERSDLIKRFQEFETNKIMILNPAAAREGITLTKANNAIYLDRNFNLVDYLQSQDRIHRISQEKECTIYKIIAKNTIDEYIDSIIELKSEISGFIQSDIENISNKSMNVLLNKAVLLNALGG